MSKPKPFTIESMKAPLGGSSPHLQISARKGVGCVQATYFVSSVRTIGLDRITCTHKLSAAIYAQEHKALCIISGGSECNKPRRRSGGL